MDQQRHPPYSSDFTPTEDSPTVASRWTRKIVAFHSPQLVTAAATIVRDLVIQALPRTPAQARIHVILDFNEDGVRIEVRDPNTPAPRTGLEVASVSEITRSLGSISRTGEHIVWAELRTLATAR